MNRAETPTLTGREREVAEMADQGVSSADIGRRLGLTSKRVSTYLAIIAEKFREHQSIQLVNEQSALRREAAAKATCERRAGMRTEEAAS